MAVSVPLFCPFCAECFEGESRCPEHDIPLVTLEELERTRARPAAAEDEEVPPMTFRFGRGPVWIGVILWVVGFLAPFVTSSEPESPTFTGLQLASGLAFNLWMVPMLAAAVVGVLSRRRTLPAMRSARLALGTLVLGVAASLGFTLYRVFSGAARLSERLGHLITIDVQVGPYLVGAGVLLALYGTVRFGHSAARPPRYRVD